ncbi:MAG: exopolyphosphatase [Lachnospiraceae bacterium]|nr:exopolyphosphatase [Lachnospiraceae bacterium]
MAGTTFAAIDIGSYNVTMEIFEITKKNGLKSLNVVRKRLELGKDTYTRKMVSPEVLDELTLILLDYSRIMKEYGVTAYRACAKTAVREARNYLLVREHIRNKTGILLEILSNSEQRFLSYKSIASRGEEFEKIIAKGTAIIDVSGGSIQISLFDKDTLITAQNLRLGLLSISTRLAAVENQTTHPERIIDQFIRKDILNFKRMHLKDRNIDTIILVGSYFTNLVFQNRLDMNKIETREEYYRWYEKIIRMSPHDAAAFLGVGTEVANAIIPMAVLYRRLIEVLGVDNIWLPGIQLTDGIAYDYALKAKIIRTQHDFDKDILMAAKHIAKRYAGNKPHTEKIMEIADAIFKAVRRESVLGPRDRLLLKVACQLNDCGKYISLVNVAECSYNIIISTEIIGLSDNERKIIANTVKYNTVPFQFYGENSDGLTEYDFLRVAQLTAILRLANSMDQSYLQKITDIRTLKKDDRLTIDVTVKEDFTLERGLFEANIEFFEDMFDIKPELKVRRVEG